MTDSDHTELVFVRHGEVHHRKTYYGRLPGFWIGPAGQEQALASARVVAASSPAARVLSSPLLRARQTAMAFCEAMPNAEFAVDLRLLEVFTSFDGCPKRVLEERNYDLYTGEGPPYEQPADVLARTLDFVREVCQRHGGTRMVAVTHGDVIAFLLGWALGMDAVPATRGRLAEHGLPQPYPDYASLSRLVFRTGRGSCQLTAVTYENPAGGIPATPLDAAAVCC